MSTHISPSQRLVPKETAISGLHLSATETFKVRPRHVCGSGPKTTPSTPTALWRLLQHPHQGWPSSQIISTQHPWWSRLRGRSLMGRSGVGRDELLLFYEEPGAAGAAGPLRQDLPPFLCWPGLPHFLTRASLSLWVMVGRGRLGSTVPHIPFDQFRTIAERQRRWLRRISRSLRAFPSRPCTQTLSHALTGAH